MASDRNTIIIKHPLVKDSLAHVRDQFTELDKFRFHSDKLCELLFTESLKGLSLAKDEVTTPLEVSAKVQKLKDEVIIVSVVRAGLAMLFGALRLLPKAKVEIVGLKRNEKTAVPKEYYWNFPPIRNGSVIILTDPMLATGGSMKHVLDKLTKAGTKPKEIRVVCVVAAPEGLKVIRAKYPNIKIFTAAVDSHLNEFKYIVPGLGDYGDRYFGTSI